MKLTPQVLAARSMRLGEGDVIRGVAGRRHQGHGGDGNALIDDGDAEFPLDVSRRWTPDVRRGGRSCHRSSGRLPSDRWLQQSEQGDAHGDGTDVQVLLVDHVDGLIKFRFC